METSAATGGTRGPDSSREGAKDPLDFRDERSFSWWQWSEKAEYQKLMGHIQVLRLRAERQLDAKKEAPARSSAALLVRHLLDASGSWRRGDEAAHVYADALEELLPLIAEKVEVDAMFTLERHRRHEGVALSDVADVAELASATDASKQRASHDSPEPATSDNTAVGKAAALSILYRVRADRLRHERLMGKHRAHYLAALAGIIISSLIAAGFAISYGHPILLRR